MRSGPAVRWTPRLVRLLSPIRLTHGLGTRRSALGRSRSVATTCPSLVRPFSAPSPDPSDLGPALVPSDHQLVGRSSARGGCAGWATAGGRQLQGEVAEHAHRTMVDRGRGNANRGSSHIERQAVRGGVTPGRRPGHCRRGAGGDCRRHDDTRRIDASHADPPSGHLEDRNNGDHRDHNGDVGTCGCNPFARFLRPSSGL